MSRRAHTTNIYFFLTNRQREGVRLIASKGSNGLERGVLHTATEHALVSKQKGVAVYKTVKVRGKKVKRLFLTTRGHVVKGL